MLFDRHEMGRPMIGGRRGIDVIAAPLHDNLEPVSVA
jgi:hypothetical protein